MTYAVSDIHGCYDKYAALLRRLDLGPDDTLYVLGDVIDRGGDGFKILLDMASRPNVKCLMGNHEAMAIKALPGILRALALEDPDAMRPDETDNMELWFCNGGELSLADFLWLNQDQEAQTWQYLRSLPLYAEAEAGNRNFVLVHGGLENFSPTRPLADYTCDEIVWCRTKVDTVYYPDKLVVLGHTPVRFLADSDESDQPRIYRTDTWINIDCGCVFQGGSLACLCLDTMNEFYI
jgi:serine/threonine protein phosphatase 1